MKPLYGVYGASGCGRGIMPLLRREMAGMDAALVFIDDNPASSHANGHEVWTFDRFMKEPAERRGAALAIANPKIRQMLDEKCRQSGVEIMAATAADIVMMDDVEIGEGALVSPYVTFTSNIKVGRCFHANLYSYVEHDCVIGDYVTFAPGVRCNGNIRIGDRAYIGSSAVIRQNLTIGADAVVGMGAIVTKDVPPGVTVVGNPARILEKK
ncbi:acetyltransferase [Rhizorhapis sp. SPR117]|uniref:acetyltransferase n=1 Tax=Rhizorhapis sp. SPR117 TaxID=2912611 RepID=UPI001F389158|nr:acetyltransferase [Rhizorhapis sp. SPR117]